MTAAEKAKSVGLKNLKELAEISGESTQTLNNWLNNYPVRFELILKGAIVKRLERL